MHEIGYGRCVSSNPGLNMINQSVILDLDDMQYIVRLTGLKTPTNNVEFILYLVEGA